jgi:hypothetical protein
LPPAEATAQWVAPCGGGRRGGGLCLPGDANCGMKLKRRRAVEVVRCLGPSVTLLPLDPRDLCADRLIAAVAKANGLGYCYQVSFYWCGLARGVDSCYFWAVRNRPG